MTTPTPQDLIDCAERMYQLLIDLSKYAEREQIISTQIEDDINAEINYYEIHHKEL